VCSEGLQFDISSSPCPVGNEQRMRQRSPRNARLSSSAASFMRDSLRPVAQDCLLHHHLVVVKRQPVVIALQSRLCVPLRQGPRIVNALLRRDPQQGSDAGTASAETWTCVTLSRLAWRRRPEPTAQRGQDCLVKARAACARQQLSEPLLRRQSSLEAPTVPPTAPDLDPLLTVAVGAKPKRTAHATWAWPHANARGNRALRAMASASGQREAKQAAAASVCNKHRCMMQSQGQIKQPAPCHAMTGTPAPPWLSRAVALTATDATNPSQQ
jgi:hypothetical protein